MDSGGNPKYSYESSSNRIVSEGRYLVRLRQLEDDNYQLRKKVNELFEWKRHMEEWINDQFEVRFNQDELEAETEDKVESADLVASDGKTNAALILLPESISDQHSAVKKKVLNGPGRRQAEATLPSSVSPTTPTDNAHNANGSSLSPSTPPVPLKKRKTEPTNVSPSPSFEAKYEPTRPATAPNPIPTSFQNGSETVNEPSAANPGSTPTNGPMLVNGISGYKPGPKSKKKLKNPEVPEDIDEEARCSVCDDKYAEENNEMLFCDKCNICVHQACYGVKEIPDSEWFCKPCAKGLQDIPKCIFCPNQGGAMVPVRSPSNKSWAHVFCTMWIPEVTFLNPDDIDLVINVNMIDKYRWALKCSLCKKGKGQGACIQCQFKRCTVAFHVTCASSNKLKMEGVLDDGLPGGVALMAWCEKHRNVV